MLKVEQLVKTYDNGRKGLRNISFTVDPGDFVVVIGPSGAGKTTLLRSINQLIQDDSGQILFEGQDMCQAKGSQLRHLRRHIGMIFQNYNLVNRLSVIENVLHGRLGYKSTLTGALGIYSAAEKQAAADVLAEVGLADFMTNRCDELSGGQQQRVGIARALMQDPKLLLCDEPIASLDPQSTTVVMDTLKALSVNKQLACIVNLHQVDIALHYATKVLAINNGQLVYAGSPEELTPAVLDGIYQGERQLTGVGA